VLEVMVSCFYMMEIPIEVCNTERLQAIEVLEGYWFCHHDGHTGEWMLCHYNSKLEAKVAYKSLYMRYFRHQDWFWIVKV
jgi:hypothetical protein